MKINKWSKYIYIQDILNIILVICSFITIIFGIILLISVPSPTAIICLCIPTFIVYAAQKAVDEYYIYHVVEPQDIIKVEQILRN